MCRSSVLLPDPEPPMITMVSPGSTSRLMPFRTMRPSKRFTTPRHEMTGSGKQNSCDRRILTLYHLNRPVLALEHLARIRPHPALENAGVDRAEVDPVLEVALVEVGQRGVIPHYSRLHHGAKGHHRCGRA